MLSSTRTGVLLRSDGLLAVLPLLAIEVFPFFRAPGPRLGAMVSIGIGKEASTVLYNSQVAVSTKSMHTVLVDLKAMTSA